MSKSRHTDQWSIWADTGGTFTDIIALSPKSETLRLKILSSSSIRGKIIAYDSQSITFESQLKLPQIKDFWIGCRAQFSQSNSQETWPIIGSQDNRVFFSSLPSNITASTLDIQSPDAPPVLAARILTQIPHGSHLPSIKFGIATTLGTNALLENKLPPVTLIINKGLEDLLAIGSQQRDDLFSLQPSRKSVLPQYTIGIPGRLNHQGVEIETIDQKQIHTLLDSHPETKGTQAYICLLHSHINPEHENLVAEWLDLGGFREIYKSSEVHCFQNLRERCETGVIQASLAPILGEYLDSISKSGERHELRVMSSGGSSLYIDEFQAKDSLLSGPAGGVIGVGYVARTQGKNKAIGLDMGGTSTDVSRYENGPVLGFSHKVGCAQINGPSVEIETVAAGGGSVCGFRNGLFHVGPESAGAKPGPACYGFGGPLTLTDVNLLSGRMDPDHFGIPVDIEASKRALDDLLKESKTELNRDSVLKGFIELANENMAEAIKAISIREGYDPSDYSLIAFGGAGGQHGCEIAELLGMNEVLCPRDGGILSALGLKESQDSVLESRQVRILEPHQNRKEIESILFSLEKICLEKMNKRGLSDHQVFRESYIAEVKIHGQSHSEIIYFKDVNCIEENFRDQYTKVFGYYPESKELQLQLDSLRVLYASKPNHIEEESYNEISMPCEEGQKIYTRSELTLNQIIPGPAIIQDNQSTIWVPNGWRAQIGNLGTVRLSPSNDPEFKSKPSQSSFLAEVYTHRLGSIAEQMGEMLKRTAISTNVKERMDYSCAVLDGQGNLVVNAPHIPVHLGALGYAVRRVIEEMVFEPGDVIVCNHPAYGGSHLPDITVIEPIYDEKLERIAFVANRAHHAEVGGTCPGSMPPDATTLQEEGVVIAPTYVFRKGKAKWKDIEKILTSAPYPTRRIHENIADLKAQIAANRKGAELILSLCESAGAQVFKQAMKHIAENARQVLKSKLKELSGFEGQSKHELDDGTEIMISIKVQNERLHLSFEGTSLKHRGNLNATRGIVQSALLYCLRLWVNKPLPLNDGLLELVDLNLPNCFLNPEFHNDPEQSPAVAGGNTETSQMIVEAFMKATGIMAGSQGTMNNFIFGNDRFSFYETIGGGTGAGPNFPGASGIHSHMTNTAITDPEILESQFPVRLRSWSMRKDSGGKGQFYGGNGLVREFEFLESMKANIISHQRIHGPTGLNHGQPGKPGSQTWRKANQNESKNLKPIEQICVEAGDRIKIETPGGGGFGDD